MYKEKFDWELGIDLLVDLAAGMLGAVGVYNFAECGVTLQQDFELQLYCIICLRFQLAQE